MLTFITITAVVFLVATCILWYRNNDLVGKNESLHKSQEHLVKKYEAELLAKEESYSKAVQNASNSIENAKKLIVELEEALTEKTSSYLVLEQANKDLIVELTSVKQSNEDLKKLNAKYLKMASDDVTIINKDGIVNVQEEPTRSRRRNRNKKSSGAKK